MARDKTTDPLVRKNVSLRRSVIATGEALTLALHKRSFSQLLSDLVLDAQNRRNSGEKNPEQYLTEIVDLLAKNRALEARLKEKMEGFKLERKGMTEALALCEEDLKRARSQAT